MFLKDNYKNKEIKDQKDHNELVQFFDLLLKIDKRENPELYKVNKKEKNGTKNK